MKRFTWSTEKDEKLRRERGVSFEQVVLLVEDRRVLDVVRNPATRRYPEQQMFIVEIDRYAYVVPFVESDEELFLKAIYPSRKATRRYLKRGQ